MKIKFFAPLLAAIGTATDLRQLTATVDGKRDNGLLAQLDSSAAYWDHVDDFFG